MNILELKQIIPEANVTKNIYGADYFYIPAGILSKRKAWNLCLSRGFEPCPNKQYLKRGNVYLYNNHLLNYIVINIQESKTWLYEGR